jgi:hypothetical protein
MPALKLHTFGRSLDCGFYLSKLKATSHWAPFSQALMPALKLIMLGRSFDCGISFGKLNATSR